PGRDVVDSRKPGYLSALAASYTDSGEPRWLTTVSLTRHSEGFYGLALGPDAAYAVGHAAEYKGGTDPAQAFGYGLISKLDLGTGDVLANFTLGSDQYDSKLNAAVWSAGGLIAAGYT